MPSVEAADAAAPAAAEYLRKLRRSMPSDEPSRRSPIALSFLAGPAARLQGGREEKPAGDGAHTAVRRTQTPTRRGRVHGFSHSRRVARKRLSRTFICARVDKTGS